MQAASMQGGSKQAGQAAKMQGRQQHAGRASSMHAGQAAHQVLQPATPQREAHGTGRQPGGAHQHLLEVCNLPQGTGWAWFACRLHIRNGEW